MATVKKIPMRMCIACRQMKPKNEMLRIVKNNNGDISLDNKGKAPGRGAYLCNSAECMEKCCKGKMLNRAFECNIAPEVYQSIKEDFIGQPK